MIVSKKLDTKISLHDIIQSKYPERERSKKKKWKNKELHVSFADSEKIAYFQKIYNQIHCLVFGLHFIGFFAHDLVMG